MAGSWQAAKRAVESHFTDKCRVTEFTEEETSWGETRFSAVQGKEVTCRLVEEGDGSDIEGLLAYPTENHIMAGSQVEVTKPDGRKVVFFTTGETLSYSTHKETVLTRKCPF